MHPKGSFAAITAKGWSVLIFSSYLIKVIVVKFISNREQKQHGNEKTQLMHKRNTVVAIGGRQRSQMLIELATTKVREIRQSVQA